VADAAAAASWPEWKALPMAYAKTSERREKQLLREQMRSLGLGYRDIAAEFGRRYRLRPRAAWRYAYGWSLQDTADRINEFRGNTGLDPGGIASMTAPHLSEYERWPGHGPKPAGRRPNPYLLAVLAAVYDCAVTDLIDLPDRQHLPPADLLILDKYTQAPAKDARRPGRDDPLALAGSPPQLVPHASNATPSPELAESPPRWDALEVPEAERLTEQLRRTFLAGGLAALTLPALGLDELKHIAAAVIDARRYADSDIAGYFRRQLDSCAVNDGRSGPRQSLPIVLGLIAVIEKMAAESKPAARRDLFRVGAYASEFAGWLYRDVCVPERANYWRDRATEWAQVSGDAAMQGYVLLKKSQAAWDERDGLRMLTLAEAAQDGPWRLPARVRAEAEQQQARGHAMLSGDLALVESKLSAARSLLDQDRTATGTPATEIAAHYDEALFGLQVAICYCEAGQPEPSLELYDRWLSRETFSRRDYGYFLALKGAAHAMAGEPDNAAAAGMDAFSLARQTESVRTAKEVTRLAIQLDRWSGRDSVHDLRNAVLAG
jgi:tetratricopeptide (TPR) repeat protein